MLNEDLNSIFLFKLEVSNKQFKKYKNRIFKEKGINITGDQWILLKNIHEVEGINQTELGQRCKKEAAAITRTLDILVRKEWISREGNPENRRVFNLYTTAQGKRIVKKILPIAIKIRKQASKDFSDKEIKMLNKFLDRIYENLS